MGVALILVWLYNLPRFLAPQAQERLKGALEVFAYVPTFATWLLAAAALLFAGGNLGFVMGYATWLWGVWSVLLFLLVVGIGAWPLDHRWAGVTLLIAAALALPLAVMSLWPGNFAHTFNATGYYLPAIAAVLLVASSYSTMQAWKVQVN